MISQHMARKKQPWRIRLFTLILLAACVGSELSLVTSVQAASPILGQVTRKAPAPTGSTATGTGTNDTFQILMLSGVCLVAAFVFILLSYLVLFPSLLHSYWPRTSYGIATAVFWVCTSTVVLIVFWSRLKLTGSGWHHAYGLRAAVGLQAIIMALVFMSMFRSRRTEG